MLALLLALAGPPAAQPPEVARPPRHRSGSISNDDYPAAALGAGEQGTSSLEIRVSPSGTVLGCSVSESSGSAVLDATSCSLVRQRFKYLPGEDASGNQVEATVRQRVRWVLPKDQFADGSVPLGPLAAAEFRFAFSADSLGVRCAIETIGEFGPSVPENPCPDGSRVTMAELERDNAAIMSITTLAPTGEPAAPRRPIRGTLMSRATINFSVDARGRLASCRESTPTGPTPMPITGFCQAMDNGRPLFLADPAGRARSARFTVEVYRLGAPEA